MPLSYVVEATGIFYDNLAWHLFEQEAFLSVTLPNKAKNTLKALAYKANDKIEAMGLSRLCTEQALEKFSSYFN